MYETRILTNEMPIISTNLLTADTIQIKTVNLSAANLIAMNATPVELIAAPGAGKALILEQVVSMFTPGTQFTGGGQISIIYDGGSTDLYANPITAAQLNGAGEFLQVHPVSTNLEATAAEATNKALKITNSTAAFATGTGTLKLFIRYRTLTL